MRKLGEVLDKVHKNRTGRKAEAHPEAEARALLSKLPRRCPSTTVRKQQSQLIERTTIMAVPKGHPGSWFAEWQGESLPCIHKHALRKGRYVDEGVTDHPAWPRFIAELREKQRAILTTSHPPGDDGIRRRKSYVGICEIGDVEVANGIMAFEVKSLLHRF